MKKNHVFFSFVVLIVGGVLMSVMNSCGEQKTAKNASLQADAQDKNEVIVVPEGKVIPYNEVSDDEEYIKEFVKDPTVVKIINYLQYYNANLYPEEDWIASLQPLYQELATKNNIGKIDYTYSGYKNLQKAIEIVDSLAGENLETNSQMKIYAGAVDSEREMSNAYSMYCLKHQFKSDPGVYYALAYANECFTAWSVAQMNLYNFLVPDDGMRGSMFALEVAGFGKHLREISPMGYLLPVLNDDQYEVPSACTLDLETLVPAEYAIIDKGIHEESYENYGYDSGKPAKVAKVAFAKYSAACSGVIALLPSEYQQKITNLVNEKNRMILVDLKTRFVNWDGSGDTPPISYKSSDAEIKAYKQ